MQKPDNSDSTDSSQEEKGELPVKSLNLEAEIENLKREINSKDRLIDALSSNRSLEPDGWYPFNTACELAGIGRRHQKQIKAKYTNKGIYKLGYDYACYGRDLIRIFITESSQSDE